MEGNLRYSSNKDNNEAVTTNSSFVFTPKAGYFVTEDLAVGVQLGLSSYKEKVELEDEDFEEKVNRYGAGVFARYYFLDLGQRFKTYGEVGVNINGSKYDDGTDGTDDIDENGFGAGLGLGINYFVTENIAISFGLSDVL
ncbi:MAG: outer membrane beta-barrel protein [Aquaticitalea sp.]